MDCLSNIIGIIETPTAEIPNVTTSDSGLWIEDTSTGRIPLKAAFYNDTARIDDIIPNAITEALGKVILATDKRLNRLYTQNHSTIGFQRDWTTYLAATAGYYYIWIDPKNINGAIAQIKEIDIWTNDGKHTGQIEIFKGGTNIYSGNQSDFTGLTVDFDDTIYILYNGHQPRDFKHTGCCGRTPTHAGYASVGSGVVDLITDIPTRVDDLPISDYCNGIEVKLTFDCDPFSFLCGLDFTRSSFGIVFAKLVQQIARKNIAYWLLSNNKVTAYAICKEDEIKGILDYLIDDIETMLNFLPENYDYSDCYLCNGIHKGEIQV